MGLDFWLRFIRITCFTRFVRVNFLHKDFLHLGWKETHWVHHGHIYLWSSLHLTQLTPTRELLRYSGLVVRLWIFIHGIVSIPRFETPYFQWVACWIRVSLAVLWLFQTVIITNVVPNIVQVPCKSRAPNICFEGIDHRILCDVALEVF